MTESISSPQLTQAQFGQITQLMYDIAKELRGMGGHQQVQGDIAGFGSGQKSYINQTIDALKEASLSSESGQEQTYDTEKLSKALSSRFEGDSQVIASGKIAQADLTQVAARRFALAAIGCKAVSILISERLIDSIENIDTTKLLQRAVMEAHKFNDKLFHTASMHVTHADRPTEEQRLFKEIATFKEPNFEISDDLLLPPNPDKAPDDSPVAKPRPPQEQQKRQWISSVGTGRQGGLHDL